MNRKTAPGIIDAVDMSLTLKPYEQFNLSNGVPVYCINTGTQDVLQLELVFFAGTWFEQKKGVAAACNFLLKNGTQSRNAFQINEAFDYYGAWCSRSCYSETAVLTLHCLNRHLDNVLPVITDMLSQSVFPQPELDIYKQNCKQRLSVNLQKADFVAGRLMDSYVYGMEHPYGQYTLAEDLDALEIEDIKAFYQNHYLQGNAIIFASGRLIAGFQEKLEAAFGQLALGAPRFLYDSKISSPATQKKYRIQNDAHAVQGAIRIAMPFPNRHHPDFKKVMLLNNVFGGFFGSRLMANIREDKGYTYGIYSYIQNHIQQSSWQISTEAGKDVAEATIAEVYKEMQTLREKPIDDDELQLVRNYMMGTILADLDGPFHIMGRWKNIVLNQLDEAYFYDSIKAIKETGAEELQALAQKYLQPENFYELVVY